SATGRRALRRRRSGALLRAETATAARVCTEAAAALTASSALTAIAAAASARVLRVGRYRLIQRGEYVGRGPEPQRRIRHAQDVGTLGDLDLQVRRHARLQLQIVVGHVDDRAVR